MFGYRVVYKRELIIQEPVKYDACQAHKPIHKFTAEIIEELTKNYEVLPKYHTLQKIILPVISSANNTSDEAESPEKPTQEEIAEKQKRQQERQNALGVLKKDGDKLYKKKTTKLWWKQIEFQENISQRAVQQAKIRS